MEPRFITDPNEVALQAAVNAADNQLLKARIKKIPVRVLDERVAAIAGRVTQSIDCTTCANCCKKLEPELSITEIHQLRAHRQASLEAFTARFLDYDTRREVHYLKPVCTFLHDNKCTVYTDRPNACREYPRLVPDLKFRWKKTMEDYMICPIVFNTIELLKAALSQLEDVPNR